MTYTEDQIKKYLEILKSYNKKIVDDVIKKVIYVVIVKTIVFVLNQVIIFAIPVEQLMVMFLVILT